MRQCDNCGEYVFADDDGELLACPYCSPRAGTDRTIRQRSHTGS